MAKRKTLSTDTLQALGAAHLAALLMDIAEGDAALKRRLRMEIAGPAQAAAEVHKRIASLKRAKSYIEWNKTKALVVDLETQLGAITGKVAPLAPAEALDLLWRWRGRFMTGAMIPMAIWAMCFIWPSPRCPIWRSRPKPTLKPLPNRCLWRCRTMAMVR